MIYHMLVNRLMTVFWKTPTRRDSHLIRSMKMKTLFKEFRKLIYYIALIFGVFRSHNCTHSCLIIYSFELFVH